MMRGNNIQMTTKVKKAELLAKLKENADRHSQIVKEAREGYIKQARAELEDRLGLIRTGKVVGLSFSLSPPQDYSDVYKTTIEMLQWTTEDLITLEADEFRQLVQDEWSWTSGFIGSTRRFSKMSDDYGNSKGY